MRLPSWLMWSAVGLLLAGCGRRNFNSRSDAAPDQGDAGEDPPSPFNLVFVTSTTVVPSQLGSLDAADAVCAERATAAGLSGTYVAWLSSSTVNARDRLAGVRGWVRTDGRPFADRIDDLISGRILHPLRIDENGDDVGVEGPHVVTGSEGNGVSASLNCGDYQVDADMVAAGSPEQVSNEWSRNDKLSCTTPMRLYCFGIDVSEPLTYTPVDGRQIFTSSAPFAVGTGRATADTLCQDEATLAGLDGSFLAALAVQGESVASRFNLAGSNWVRLDGIPVAASPLAFMSAQIDAPPNLTSAMVYEEYEVWTGVGDLQEVAGGADHCNGWTDTGQTGARGKSWDSDSDFVYTGTKSCATGSIHVLCLEE